MLERYDKPVLSFRQQVELLESRGLVIDNRALAEAALADTNYYRLSAYWIPFQQERDIFRPGTAFEDIRALYEFDQKLRIGVVQGLERFEIAFRTTAANYLADTYGPFAHADSANFDPSFNHAAWYGKLVEEITRARETFIDHYKAKYEGFPALPIWMAVEVMSFGSLSYLYRGMKRRDRESISTRFDAAEPVMVSWLHTLVYIRNLCAHHSRLWNRDLAVAPILPRSNRDWHPPSFAGNKRIASVLFVLNHLLKKLSRGSDLAPNWRAKIVSLCDGGAPLRDFESHMGFPENWRTHKLWS